MPPRCCLLALGDTCTCSQNSPYDPPYTQIKLIAISLTYLNLARGIWGKNILGIIRRTCTRLPDSKKDAPGVDGDSLRSIGTSLLLQNASILQTIRRLILSEVLVRSQTRLVLPQSSQGSTVLSGTNLWSLLV